MENLYESIGQAIYYYNEYEKEAIKSGKTPVPFIKFLFGKC